MIGDARHPLQNRAIQNQFSPGSVFKIFEAYGALAKGLVNPDEKVFCPGYATFYGRTFRCHKKEGHGWVGLRDAIKMSCDVYFYNLGRRLGIDRIAEIARGFGLGEPTGVDLAYEKSGNVPSEEWARTKRGARWYPSETISVAIGQGPVLVTPIQIARALSGLVEGGRLPTPHLFYASQVPGTGEKLRYTPEAKQGLALDADKVAIVTNGMWAVLNEPGGTAYLQGHVPGLSTAGKTGTTQVVGRETSEGLPKSKRIGDHAWFAGFAPVEDPQIVVVVFVENGGHGSTAAAPLAKAIFEKKFGKTRWTRRCPPPASSGRATGWESGRDHARASRSEASGPRRPRVLSFAGGPGRVVRLLDHRERPSGRAGRPAGPVGRRRYRRDGGRDALRLPHAPEVLPRPVLRHAGPTDLPAAVRRADRQRPFLDSRRRLPVPASGARQDRHGAARRLHVRERRRREAEGRHPPEARRDRRHALPADVPAARPRPRADFPADRLHRPLLRGPAVARLGRDRVDLRRSGRCRLVPSQGLPEGAHRHLLEPRRGHARCGLPGAPVEDRGGLRRLFGQGLRRRDAEPVAVPSRPARRFHPGRGRRGMGVSGHPPRARPLHRSRSSRA